MNKVTAQQIVQIVSNYWTQEKCPMLVKRIAEKAGCSYGGVLSVLHRDRTWLEDIRVTKIPTPVLEKQTGNLLRYRPSLAYEPIKKSS